MRVTYSIDHFLGIGHRIEVAVICHVVWLIGLGSQLIYRARQSVYQRGMFIESREMSVQRFAVTLPTFPGDFGRLSFFKAVSPSEFFSRMRSCMIYRLGLCSLRRHGS